MKIRSQYILIALVSLFFLIFDNFAFFYKTLNIYKISSNNILELLSLYLGLFCTIFLIFTLLSSKYTTKILLIIALLISSLTSYFMNNYNIVINHEMINNIIQTDLDEALDLFSYKLLTYLFLLGILPSFFVYKINISYFSLKKELFLKVKFLFVSLLTVLIILFSFSKFYTSFFREHKSLRYYTNPLYWMYNVGEFVIRSIKKNNIPTNLKIIGQDATINASAKNKKRLVILVVGEAVRAENLPFNGYKRNTMPLLSKEDIINFSNMYSCGTSTAISVPCMFSIYERKNYDHIKAINTQNLLDVLNHTNKIDILWRDNNSSSKGVATRVAYEDFRGSKVNKICDIECRDEGMLGNLDKYIKNHQNNNIFIVFHQRGNHGPAYYKRYPKKFEKFLPVCETNQLEECTAEEIRNAYDNALLYTDYFLSNTIKFLKSHSKKHEVALFYISDHGESLGENRIYLHGLPYFIAPQNQKHVGAFMWLGKSYRKNIDVKKLNLYKDNSFSHDEIFHTLLGLFNVDTNLYVKEKDILNNARK